MDGHLRGIAPGHPSPWRGNALVDLDSLARYPGLILGSRGTCGGCNALLRRIRTVDRRGAAVVDPGDCDCPDESRQGDRDEVLLQRQLRNHQHADTDQCGNPASTPQSRSKAHPSGTDGSQIELSRIDIDQNPGAKRGSADDSDNQGQRLHSIAQQRQRNHGRGEEGEACTRTRPHS